MKYILIITLFFGFLQAKSSDACYSVQLKSFYLKRNSSYDFERQNYPNSCILVNINGLRSVRCGCYDNYREAEDNLDRLSQRYYDAIIVNTYKRRFSNKAYDDAYHSTSSNSGEDDFSKKSSYNEYPSAPKKTHKKSRYDDFEDDFEKNNEHENEKSLYEDESKITKRSFYGQEEEDDLYEKEDIEPATPEKHEEKDKFYDDESEGSSQNYYRKPNRDYARTSGRW